MEGLAELRRDLRKAEKVEDAAELRAGMKKAANVVAVETRSRMPVKSGMAQNSVRAVSGGNKAYVVGGRAKVKYYGWLDFGSRSPISGRRRSVGPWKGSGRGPKEGRFIYPAIKAKQDDVTKIIRDVVSKALNKLNL